MRVVLPAPEGAEITKRMPLRWMVRLFNVGELFSNAVEFRFRLDDEARDGGVCGLRAERIEFAAEFLREKFQCAADWAFGIEFFAELGDVARGSLQLFRDVATLGENGDLGREAGIIRCEAQSGTPDAPVEGFAIRGSHLAGKWCGFFDDGGQPVGAFSEDFFQRGTFARSRCDEPIQCAIERGHNDFAGIIDLRIRGLKDARS